MKNSLGFCRIYSLHYNRNFIKVTYKRSNDKYIYDFVIQKLLYGENTTENLINKKAIIIEF